MLQVDSAQVPHRERSLALSAVTITQMVTRFLMPRLYWRILGKATSELKATETELKKAFSFIKCCLYERWLSVLHELVDDLLSLQ